MVETVTCKGRSDRKKAAASDKEKTAVLADIREETAGRETLFVFRYEVETRRTIMEETKYTWPYPNEAGQEEVI